MCVCVCVCVCVCDELVPPLSLPSKSSGCTRIVPISVPICPGVSGYVLELPSFGFNTRWSPRFLKKWLQVPQGGNPQLLYFAYNRWWPGTTSTVHFVYTRISNPPDMSSSGPHKTNVYASLRQVQDTTTRAKLLPCPLSANAAINTNAL